MQFMWFLLIIIAIIAIPIWLKKKKSKEVNEALSQRKNKDEVWKTIKQFLKENDERGVEIYDSYVIKRNALDYIPVNASRLEKINKKYEIKIRNRQKKAAKKLAKQNKQKYIPEPIRELYVVLFATRNSKTGVVSPYRAIECEVVNRRISKKDYDRQILINGELDYNKEMEWISPIKAAEETKNAKANAKAEQLARKKQEKLKMKLEKEKLRAAKQNAKAENKKKK